MMVMALVDALMMQQVLCYLFPNEAGVDARLNPMVMTAKGEGGMREFASWRLGRMVGDQSVSVWMRIK